MQLSETKCVEIEGELNPFAVQLEEPMAEQASIFIPLKLTAGLYDGRGYYRG